MDGHAVTLRLHGDLGDLAADVDESGTVDVPAGPPRSVKDAVESCGIPHTEVDALVVGDRMVGFGAPVPVGGIVDVHPPSHATRRWDPPTRPPAPETLAFLCDVHLGRLAGRLRLLGFDTRYDHALDDADLAEAADAENRWLLTRDRGLLMRAIVTHGYLLRATDPDAQLIEVARRFDLAEQLAPLTRCARCNGRLRAVAKSAVLDRLEPATRVEQDRFAQCERCGQVYWPGSHSGPLHDMIDRVRATGRWPT